MSEENRSISEGDELVRLLASASDPALGQKLIALGIVQPSPAAAVLDTVESNYTLSAWYESLVCRRKTPDGRVVAPILRVAAGNRILVPRMMVRQPDVHAGMCVAGVKPTYDGLDSTGGSILLKTQGACVLFWWIETKVLSLRTAVMVGAPAEATYRTVMFENGARARLSDREIESYRRRIQRKNG